MKTRPKLTIGIEEEYQVVDPESGELRSFITQFIEDGKMVMIERDIKPELHQSMVEMGTPVCDTPAQAMEELVRQRSLLPNWPKIRGWRLWPRPPIPSAAGPTSR